jgi:hypothetical protein
VDLLGVEVGTAEGYRAVECTPTMDGGTGPVFCPVPWIEIRDPSGRPVARIEAVVGPAGGVLGARGGAPPAGG